jgi:hypothetical protein
MKDLSYITGSLAKTGPLTYRVEVSHSKFPLCLLPNKVRPQSKSLLDFLSIVVFQLYVALYNLCSADSNVKLS